MTTQKDLSYFKIRLQELLNASFPERAWDKHFIEQRSQVAALTYEAAFKAGNSISHCDEIAAIVLFEGLQFSRFDIIFKVICQEFDTLMADEALRPFALQMLQVCEPIFEAYDTSDDFASTTDLNYLYTELTGTIAIWINENGLQ